MPPEPNEVREWLRKADHDRRMSEAGLAQRPPITDAAAFHCQQAIEQLLKAYLVSRQSDFEKIHDLEVLVEQCGQSDARFAELRTRVAPLTAYAVRFRYPGAPDPSVQAIETALAVVADVRQFVVERLPSRVTA